MNGKNLKNSQNNKQNVWIDFCNNRIEAKKDEEEILSALEDTNNAYLLQSE